MLKDRGMRILLISSKLSLIFETFIVFYNCIFFSCFTRVNMASDFFSKMVIQKNERSSWSNHLWFASQLFSLYGICLIEVAKLGQNFFWSYFMYISVRNTFL